MTHLYPVTLTLVLCLALSAGTVCAQGTEPEPADTGPVSQTGQTAINELDRLLSDTRTLFADVTQVIVESDGGVLEESRIRMYLKKPGGFYWETLEPFPELVVTNGDKLWNYQPDLEQVVVEDWERSRSELAAQLLNGETASLASEYRVRQLPGSQQVTEFQLTPLAADSVYEQIAISFLDSKLDTIHMHNKNGEQTVWRFNNVRRNLKLDDALFNFEVPEGIEVISNDFVD